MTKTKPRVVLVGDSFTFGDGLAAEETVRAHLQKLLGNSFEVINLSGSGYSFAQIGIVATQIAPLYSPDYVIAAFIADDLLRTCVRCVGGIVRPTYENGVLAHVPVPLHEELLEEHAHPWSKIRDRSLALLSRSRLMQLAFEPYFVAKKKRCLVETNTAVLKDIEKALGADSHLLFVHLQGALPPAFVKELEAKENRFVSLAGKEFEIGKLWGIVPGVLDGYHPDSQGTLLHAKVYAAWIQQNRL